MKISRRQWRIVIQGLIGLVSILMLGWFLLPKPSLLDDFSFSRQVVDRHHKLLRVTLTPDEKYRIETPLSGIAPELIQATLLHEDRFYHQHPGINLVAISRSAWNLLIHGKAHAGASTITMQLARLRFQIHSRTLSGKLEQIYRALQLERHYSKSQILEAYFNLAPYGRNIEGIGAASLLYFGKPPAQLSLPEAVALSVIPQSPTRRALYCDRENPALTAPQSRLFELMSPKFGGQAFRAISHYSLPFIAPHLTRQLLRENPGTREIVTTVDLDLQHTLERCIQDYLKTHHELGITNAAALLLDANSMETLAEVGSADFFDSSIQGQIDGTRCKRSPGSTLKPFVYALAMDQGLIHPLTILVDAPHSFAGYNPENFDREFVGPIRATDALARSRNIPAITLTSQLSHPRFYEWLKTEGIDLPQEESYYGLTLPLGGAEVNLTDLVRLYGSLVNDGRIKPIQKILPYQQNPGKRAISPEAAFLVLEMLKNRLSGSNNETPVFYKTGTSNGFHDAWTVGVFGQYLLAIWIGNFDGRSNPAFIGRTCAAPLLFRVIDTLQAKGEIHWKAHLPPPGSNLRSVEFCAVSGQLPLAGCKDRVTGWFIPGVTPISTCNVHREILVDEATGLRVAVDDGTRILKHEVYEFWPSNLQELFAQAGLPRRLPPPFLPGSGPETVSLTKGKALRIVSPRSGLIYAVGSHDNETRSLSLKADTDSDVAMVYWFAGKIFLGSTRRQETLAWHPSPGRYTVTALDDHGRSDTVDTMIQSTEGQ